jgi:hypothetical protein
MRHVVELGVLGLAFAAGGCEKRESAGAPPQTPAASVPISLSDVEGKWRMRILAVNVDTTVLEFGFVAVGDPSTWKLILPGRDPVPVRASTSGDSLIAEAGPYKSVLHEGATVAIRGVLRIRDNTLTGVTTAVYTGLGQDSVRYLRTEGTRE